MGDSSKSTVRIELNAAGIGTAKIDDLDVSNSVTRVTLDAKPGLGTGLTLHMTPGIMAAAIDAAGAKVDPDTHEALVALGWMPPSDGQAEAREVDGVLDHFVEQEYVLTWHPLTEGWTEPIRLPLNEHVEWADGIGEFKLEVRTLADEAPEVSGG